MGRICMAPTGLWPTLCSLTLGKLTTSVSGKMRLVNISCRVRGMLDMPRGSGNLMCRRGKKTLVCSISTWKIFHSTSLKYNHVISYIYIYGLISYVSRLSMKLQTEQLRLIMMLSVFLKCPQQSPPENIDMGHFYEISSLTPGRF